MSEIHKKLVKIQSELNCPKNQRNNFGNYNYRSCEDIVEAVKPLLHEEGLILLMWDEIINVGNHNYIKSTARIHDGENEITVYAIAREAESQKGMSDSQLTGATSSYARKYALNGLFAIDDTKDADTMKPAEKEERKPAQKAAPQRNWIKEIQTTTTLDELKSIFGEAYNATEGEQKAKVKMEYDKKKQTLKGE